MTNFEEILKFKKENPDKVILLMGNHDLGYFDSDICSCRQYRRSEREDIVNILMDNIDLFDICHDEFINGKHFVYSHAGIRREWNETIINDFFPEKKYDCNKMLPCEEYNKLFINAFKSQDNNEMSNNFKYYLSTLSFLRGGYKSYGSIVWADIREFADRYLDGKKMENNTSFDDIIQIVGHTQLSAKAVSINDRIYDLDVREPFYIDNDGNVRYYRTNKIVSCKEDNND